MAEVEKFMTVSAGDIEKIMGVGFDADTSGASEYRDPDLSYVTIASTGNSTDAGDDTLGRNYVSSNSGDTRE